MDPEKPPQPQQQQQLHQQPPPQRRRTRLGGAGGEPSDEAGESEEDQRIDAAAAEAFEREYAQDGGAGGGAAGAAAAAAAAAAGPAPQQLHSWEAIQEDEHGRLRAVDAASLAAAQRRARRRRASEAALTARVRKGLIRYCLLAVDLSSAAAGHDLRPNRTAAMLMAARQFVRAYFEANPLSHLGLVLLRDGRAERLSDLGCSPDALVERLQTGCPDPKGDLSLQNGLELCTALLAHCPPYGHREVVLLLAALSTVDPGDASAAIRAARDAKVRVSVVGVAGEVYVFKKAAASTGGTYAVALDEPHLRELLRAHAPPPPAPSSRVAAQLVRMGFPTRASQDPATGQAIAGRDARLKAGSYCCPRCRSRCEELPTSCHVCGLTLISSAQLARSYHHLFPVRPYDELDKPGQVIGLVNVGPGGDRGGLGGVGGESGARMEEDEKDEDDDEKAAAALRPPLPDPVERYAPGSLVCFGCSCDLTGAVVAARAAAVEPDVPDGEDPLTGVGPGEAARAAAAAAAAAMDAGGEPPPMVLRCPLCRHAFCFDCDAYVHERLHNCPGCECSGAGAATAEDEAEQARGIGGAAAAGAAAVVAAAAG
jgi:transcription initiation factor TFIIH subunit 2